LVRVRGGYFQADYAETDASREVRSRMSVRDQERKEREVMRHAGQVERRIRRQEKEADKRADEVVRRIEKGDVTPRELPGKKEDSIESIGNMESIGSMESS
jgi:hypothetical protein